MPLPALFAEQPTMKMFSFFATHAMRHTIHTVSTLTESRQHTGSVWNVRKMVHSHTLLRVKLLGHKHCQDGINPEPKQQFVGLVNV